MALPQPKVLNLASWMMPLSILRIQLERVAAGDGAHLAHALASSISPTFFGLRKCSLTLSVYSHMALLQNLRVAQAEGGRIGLKYTRLPCAQGVVANFIDSVGINA